VSPHGQRAEVPAWSLFVRLSHWAVAAIVLFDFFGDTGEWHRDLGYAAACLVALRVFHGLSRPREDAAHVGLPRPAALIQHVQGLLRGHARRELGHNPAGLCMALLMWTLVLALGVTGWMTQSDAYWGEDWLIGLHTWLARALQACVLAHWAGVIVMSRLQKENLAKAMLTGRKRAP
jgi:cytochrome b